MYFFTIITLLQKYPSPNCLMCQHPDKRLLIPHFAIPLQLLIEKLDAVMRLKFHFVIIRFFDGVLAY